MNSAAPAATASTLPPPVTKTCTCGIQHTERDLMGLRYVGLQDNGEGGWYALRNCHCGSTMAVPS